MSANKIRFWRKLESISELDNTQRYFLTLWAHGETAGHFNADAHNGTQSERDAAAAGVRNNPHLLELATSCGIPRANLESGSWGLPQRLAPFIVSDAFAVFGSLACRFADPLRFQLDEDWQIADMIKVARTLQGGQRFASFPTVGNLRLGTAAVALMGHPNENADRLEKYRRHAQHAGLPDGIVDTRIRLFPQNYVAIYSNLRARAQ